MSKKIKQISYLMAIFLVVGGTIGAGIFVKNGSVFNNSHGSLWIAIASWVIAGFGVIAMALALAELTTATKNDKGLLAWVKNFAPKKLSKYSVNYMLFVYLPLNYFAMPLYIVMSISDATGWNPSAWVIAGLGFGIFLWLALMGYFSLKSSIVFHWIFTIAKFLPLLVAPLITIATPGHSIVTNQGFQQPPGITGASMWFGILASIPAILFAFDGFHTVTSLKSNLKDEKHLGPVVAVGLAIVTVLYLFFAILTGMYATNIIYTPTYGYTLKVFFNTMILMSIIGILNSYAMITWRIYEESYHDGDFSLLKWVQMKLAWSGKKLSPKQVAMLLSVVFGIISYIILIPIGIYTLDPVGMYKVYGMQAASLYGFADSITNYTSLAIFVMIAVAIAGGISNRKTNKIVVNKYKSFLPAAWIAMLFILIATSYFFIDQFTVISGYNATHDQQVDATIKMVILLITLIISYIPIGIDTIKGNKKWKKERQLLT